MTNRLLHVHIFSGLAGPDGLESMPVIGSGNDDDINILVIKQFAEKEVYTMVFNDRVLVYQDKSLDITDKIIAILNKGSKK